jgi:hypothetical protein
MDLKVDLVKRVREAMDATEHQRKLVSDHIQGRNINTTEEEGIELDDLGKDKGKAR